MSLTTEEFIRRFLIHVLPRGFHRIRHYGWLANTRRNENLAHARRLLDAEITDASENHADEDSETPLWLRCRACGARLRIIEVLQPRWHRPPPLPRAGDPP